MGTVNFSDYPEAARKVPQVGGYDRFDLEAVVALKPDLVIGWQSGNAPAQLDKLKALGVPVFVLQPNRLEDVAGQLEQMGPAGWHRSRGQTPPPPVSASAWRACARPTAASRRWVFYQVWKTPLMTVGRPQIISDLIHLCSGDNVFGKLDQMAPTVSVEAVLAADPRSSSPPAWATTAPNGSTTGGSGRTSPQSSARTSSTSAPTSCSATPRLLDGAERLCAVLEEARTRRPRLSESLAGKSHAPSAPAHRLPYHRNRRGALRPGEEDRIAGITGYTVRPARARKEKPKVFAFTSGDIDKILAVGPDLVLTFSDLQADIARDLIKAGVPVAFNQRGVDDILAMVETLGRLVGAEAKAGRLVAELEAVIAATRRAAEAAWPAPAGGPGLFRRMGRTNITTGIRWVSELIEIAGGETIFAARAASPWPTASSPTLWKSRRGR